jgi:hypothetical protein
MLHVIMSSAVMLIVVAPVKYLKEILEKNKQQ